MTEEVEYNYRDLCPDGGDKEDFNNGAITLVKNVKETLIPEIKPDKGYKDQINRNIDSVRNALLKLSDQSREIIRRREINEEVERRIEKRESMESALYNAEKSFIGRESILDKFEKLIEEDYRGKKENIRLAKTTVIAGVLWQTYGGKITSTQNITGFVAFLERLLCDIGLDADPRTLIDKYLK